MSERYALVADIGGTNARFGLTDTTAAHTTVEAVHSLRCAEFASVKQATMHYLKQVDVKPIRAGIALACPVGGEVIRMTNRAWSFARDELQSALTLETLLLLNDFGAVAHAVPALTADDHVCLHPGTQGGLAGPISILGPGTGLGVAALIGDEVRGWQVLETEGGHVSFAPLGDEESAIAKWLTARFGRASNERLLSGAGLSHIHAALAGSEAALRDPADIVAGSLSGEDLLARRALSRFCAVLGSVAGDTALIHGARSVLIAGGIVPRFVPFLKASAFRERFLAKGRFAPHLETVAIHVITHPQPGLLGAAQALRAAQPQLEYSA